MNGDPPGSAMLLIDANDLLALIVSVQFPSIRKLKFSLDAAVPNKRALCSCLALGADIEEGLPLFMSYPET
jgi:hypothetical protein